MTESNDKILDAVYEILIQKGVKSTTMDFIARQLQMSKRTLYEMYDNKTALLSKAMEHHADKHRKICEDIALSSPDIMESLVKIFKLHRDNLSRVNVKFFRDMDRLHPRFRDDYETRHDNHRKQLMLMFRLGVQQGVFRDDINFSALIRIIELQMESIIRMEEIYTGDMNITDVFDTVMICYLRAIASTKGLEILDKAIPKYFPELTSGKSTTGK
ncbi:MAG: TetR/AcrR family transcriptional regulator [Muribaculaceae bacterium]|nr:TetR/AcrR family transcriptional regulator [Muribaculaceae bacterium]